MVAANLLDDSRSSLEACVGPSSGWNAELEPYVEFPVRPDFVVLAAVPPQDTRGTDQAVRMEESRQH